MNPSQPTSNVLPANVAKIVEEMNSQLSQIEDKTLFIRTPVLRNETVQEEKTILETVLKNVLSRIVEINSTL